ENDLARHGPGSEQLLRASRLHKGNSLRNERPDLLLFEQVEQDLQIVPKQRRLQAFEPLDAVGHHPLSARKKPASCDVQPEDGDSTNTMTTARTTRSQAPSTEGGGEAIGHDGAARPESPARAPDVGPTDTVEDNVYAVAREATDLLHEVDVLVVDRD